MALNTAFYVGWTGTEGDKNIPKPGHGHSINTDKPKQNSFSHTIMKSIEFSFQKSIPDHILAKSKGYNSPMTYPTQANIASCTSTTPD